MPLWVWILIGIGCLLFAFIFWAMLRAADDDYK